MGGVFTPFVSLLTKYFPYDKHIEKPEHKEGKMNKLNTIFKSKDQEVTVMETNDFYKTELGQKVLADLREKKWDREWILSNDFSWYEFYIGDKYQDGYAIKRGDNYFLVNHNLRPRSREADADLYLIHEYCITPITKDGKVDNCNRIDALIKAKLNYEDFSYEPNNFSPCGIGLNTLTFTATDLQKRFKTYAKVEKSIFSKDGYSRNDDLFNKFIAPDPHWFECATHYDDRQEVLNGTARSVFKVDPATEMRKFLWTQWKIRNRKLSYRIINGAKNLRDAVVAKRQMYKRIREL